MFGKSKILRAKLRTKFGSNPLEAVDLFRVEDRMERICIYADETAEEDASYIDDITWSDLEMDTVFYRTNQTKCYIGEQFLYKRLHDLDADRDWDSYEKRLEYFTDHEEERLALEEKLNRIGKRQGDYYLPVFLNHSEEYMLKNGAVYHILQGLLVFFLVASLVTWGNSAALLGLIATCLVNFVVYLLIKKNYEVYMHSLGSIGALISFCGALVKDDAQAELLGASQWKKDIQELSKLSRRVGNYQSRTYAASTGDVGSVFQEYLMGITLYDVSMFNHMMKVIDKKQDVIWKLYELVGEIDMGISIASFRESIDGYCMPEFSEEHHISIKEIYHPLIDGCVSNDFDMTSNALITGANASGKSTFMKTVALNIVFSQTIHTCTASMFKVPKLCVMTSMALRDDVMSGESYYIREIKYLKRMIDQADRGIPVFCVIDEILKGTNTNERIAASESILKYFSKTNSFVMVASHDTELIEKMRSQYDSYYFESQILESDIRFDYQIHKGIGGNVNAIALLRCFGYPAQITDMATQLIHE